MSGSATAASAIMVSNTGDNRTTGLVPSRRCKRNALKTGHCAPTVMKTLLEEEGACPDPDMVRSAGGMPGVGGKGECGAICAPLMVFGLRHAGERTKAGLPLPVLVGGEYIRRFRQVHGGVTCPEISPKGMGACLRAMCLSPALCEEVSAKGKSLESSLEPQTSAAYLSLLAGFEREGFHCAHRVLDEMSDVVAPTEKSRRASSAFVGGMALSGGACGALAAGIMAISSKVSGIENSYLRTATMALMMMLGLKAAMSDGVNACNKAVRMAGSLSRWFEGKYGTTRCSALIGADLGSPDAVAAFCASGIESCVERTRAVACEARRIIQQEG